MYHDQMFFIQQSIKNLTDTLHEFSMIAHGSIKGYSVDQSTQIDMFVSKISSCLHAAYAIAADKRYCMESDITKEDILEISIPASSKKLSNLGMFLHNTLGMSAEDINAIQNGAATKEEMLTIANKVFADKNSESLFSNCAMASSESNIKL